MAVHLLLIGSSAADLGKVPADPRLLDRHLLLPCSLVLDSLRLGVLLSIDDCDSREFCPGTQVTMILKKSE